MASLETLLCSAPAWILAALASVARPRVHTKMTPLVALAVAHRCSLVKSFAGYVDYVLFCAFLP